MTDFTPEQIEAGRKLFAGPVAFANVRGSEKMPAPTMPPTTIAVSCIRDIF